MGFIIGDNIIDIYQDGIDSIINQLGKKVILIMPQKETNCPNCYFDGRNNRSTGRYVESNPNPLGALNKPFKNGQRCPVCQGRGKISEGKSQIQIKATVKWGPKEYIEEDRGQIILPNNICKIKTFATYAENIKNAIEFHVAAYETTEGSPKLLKCKLEQEPVARGLKYNRYVEAYLKRVENG